MCVIDMLCATMSILGMFARAHNVELETCDSLKQTCGFPVWQRSYAVLLHQSFEGFQGWT